MFSGTKSVRRVAAIIALATGGIGIGDAAIAGGRLRSMGVEVVSASVQAIRRGIMSEQMKLDEVKQAISNDQKKLVASRAKYLDSKKAAQKLADKKDSLENEVKRHTEHLGLLSKESQFDYTIKTIAAVTHKRDACLSNISQITPQIAALTAANDRVNIVLDKAQKDIDFRWDSIKLEEARRQSATAENEVLNSALAALDNLPEKNDSSASLYADLVADTDKLIAENSAKSELLAHLGSSDELATDDIPASLTLESLKKKQASLVSAGAQ